MCGILFVADYNHRINDEIFFKALNSQSWRGPDVSDYKFYSNNCFKLGHNRLTILDNSVEANMPMEKSNCSIIFNGEIYNHLILREKYNLICNTLSDTETILEGFLKFGEDFFLELRGMFSFVIFNKLDNSWICMRDPFGIKPLYFYQSDGLIIIASESIAIRNLLNFEVTISNDSILEWKSFRRPLPGKTFFNEISEVLPGFLIDSFGRNFKFFDFKTQINSSSNDFNDDEFLKILTNSVDIHQINDFKSVSLLSGGLDSAVILGLSKVENSYSVGLNGNNEFIGAQDSANVLNRSLKTLELEPNQLKEAWKHLLTIRGEPLSLPNEGLIYLICKEMEIDEKVLLTGEGADELLFGYDNIFKWANSSLEFDLNQFLDYYTYNFCGLTERMKKYIFQLAEDKSVLDFLEDFFIEFHLPGLLRRMDFASMAASKEARVPFVDIELFKYLYRKPYNVRNRRNRSKFPIVFIAEKLGLFGAIERKKIGFSATMNNLDRKKEYMEFQNFCLSVLNW
jgi:asparagine synthase (glutamine-hydrolysing)